MADLKYVILLNSSYQCTLIQKFNYTPFPLPSVVIHPDICHNISIYSMYTLIVLKHAWLHRNVYYGLLGMETQFNPFCLYVNSQSHAVTSNHGCILISSLFPS